MLLKKLFYFDRVGRDVNSQVMYLTNGVILSHRNADTVSAALASTFTV